MASYYYSTQPFLAWCLNHYFYGGLHYAWVAAPFYPYRLPNPRSSSPLRKYEDFYEPWKDDDEFSYFIEAARAKLRNGVIAHQNQLRPAEVNRLKYVCDHIHTVFFFPIVYRIDLNEIDAPRREVSNSGFRGSQEYLIRALDEREFDVLFADFETDVVPHSFSDFWNGSLPKANIWNIFGYWMTL